MSKWKGLTAGLFLCLMVMPVQAVGFSGIGAMLGDTDAVAIAEPGGKILYSKNADAMLVPASILKIVTALVAFEHLGPDYRFPTEFYMDDAQNLVIRGYGDPYLISESVAKIARRLSLELGTVNDIVMDGGYFDPAIMIPGARTASARAYDAPVGAVCVNFNTVNFETQNGRIVSAEPQTPLLPTALARIRDLKMTEGRVMLSSDDNQAAQYAGELFQYFLEKEGISVSGGVRVANTGTGSTRLVYRHYAETDVSGLVSRMMEFSNNFIANQLFLAAGASAFGAPATLEKGVRAAMDYTRRLGIDPAVVEGSGISRNNRWTAKMMITILDEFSPHYALLQKNNGIYYKTGTLAGIQTRAGYIPGKDGMRYPFVVIINTYGRHADPVVKRIAGRLAAGP